MSRSRRLPPALLGTAFTTAEARAAGMTAAELRNPTLGKPTRGLRVTVPVVTFDERCTAVATVLEGEWAVCHRTAGRLLGLPLPHSWRPDEPVHVMVPTTVNRTRRPGVIGHRGLESRRVTWVGVFPVVTAAQTWADMAAGRDGRGRLSLDDLVVVGDAILAASPHQPTALRKEVERRTGARGIRALREACEQVRPGSASPMESRARLRFLRAGLPEPELNQDVVDAGGRWLARVDLLWRRQRVVVEYEGDQHRADRLQWQRDIDRVRRLEEAGWRVVRMSAEDLTDPARWSGLLRLLRRLLADDPGRRDRGSPSTGQTMLRHADGRDTCWPLAGAERGAGAEAERERSGGQERKRSGSGAGGGAGGGSAVGGRSGSGAGSGEAQAGASVILER